MLNPMIWLFVLALIAMAAVFAGLFVLTERQGSGRQGYSPWQYGSGAGHAPQELPSISQAATSVPTGSSDPSVWPGRRTVRNRTPQQH